MSCTLLMWNNQMKFGIKWISIWECKMRFARSDGIQMKTLFRFYASPILSDKSCTTHMNEIIQDMVWQCIGHAKKVKNLIIKYPKCYLFPFYFRNNSLRWISGLKARQPFSQKIKSFTSKNLRLKWIANFKKCRSLLNFHSYPICTYRRGISTWTK